MQPGDEFIASTKLYGGSINQFNHAFKNFDWRVKWADPDDPDANPKVLRRLAQETGGQAFFPAKLSETVEICERIARDIRDQYTIGYSSANEKRDGSYHKVRLTARAKADGKLSVRTRAGYSTEALPSQAKAPVR